jgi:predicted  nucleic acid-binding Zn-ribbon protein
MSEPFVITRQEWQQLQDQIRRIEEAITGGLEGKGGLRSRVDSLEKDIQHCKENAAHEIAVIREHVAALEESRRWIVRLVSGAVITTVVSALIAALQMMGKH